MIVSDFCNAMKTVQVNNVKTDQFYQSNMVLILSNFIMFSVPKYSHHDNMYQIFRQGVRIHASTREGRSCDFSILCKTLQYEPYMALIIEEVMHYKIHHKVRVLDVLNFISVSLNGHLVYSTLKWSRIADRIQNFESNPRAFSFLNSKTSLRWSMTRR